MSKQPRKKDFSITITLYDGEGEAVNKFMEDVNREAPAGTALSHETVTKQALFRTIQSAYKTADLLAAQMERDNGNTGSTESEATISTGGTPAVSGSTQE